MKRFVAFFAVLLLFCVTPRQVCAESERDYVQEFLSSLPTLAEEKIGDAVREGDVSQLVSVEYLASLAFDGFFSGIDAGAGDFFILLALTLLFAAFSLLRENVNENIGKTAENVFLVVVALTVYRLFSDGVSMAYSFVADAKNFVNSLIPITTGLYLMGGNTATAVSSGAGAGAALVCIENLCSLALSPLICVTFSLSLIGSIGKNVNYGVICRQIKNAYMSLLGFFTMVLSASLSFGNAISSAADTVAARAVKYAIGNMIPIVGSTVNSSYGTLSASVSMIKNTVGVSAIIALAIITLPVIVRLLFVRISLNICTTAAEMLGCDRIGKLYTDFRSVYDLVLSSIVFVSLVFVIIFSVFLRSAVAIG